MSPESFECLLAHVGPLITKQSTKFREAIPAAERLTLTLRYLASGDSQQSMSFSYRLGRTTVGGIIYETCLAIWEALHLEYVKVPNSIAEWKSISNEFMDLWDFPHCIGALYFNYKKFFSIVLLAVCDARYF
jgi:hypothetical protein